MDSRRQHATAYIYHGGLLQVRTINYGMSPDKPSRLQKFPDKQNQIIGRIAASYHPPKASIDPCNYNSAETTNAVQIRRTIHPWFQYSFTGSARKHTKQAMNQTIELRFSTINSGISDQQPSS
jgi:hypothetical protein